MDELLSIWYAWLRFCRVGNEAFSKDVEHLVALFLGEASEDPRYHGLRQDMHGKIGTQINDIKDAKGVIFLYEAILKAKCNLMSVLYV